MWQKLISIGQHTVYAEGNMRILATGTVIEHIYHTNRKKDNKLQKLFAMGNLGLSYLSLACRRYRYEI